MRTRRQSFLNRVWVAIILQIALPVFAAQNTGDLTGKRVLVLFSYHPTFSSSRPVRSGLLEALKPNGVDVTIEYMDSKRYNDPEALGRYRGLLAHKLSLSEPFDVVVASDDNAFNFAVAEQDSLFTGAPIVFLGVNDAKRAVAMNDNPRVTGVVEHVSIAETLRLARSLDPGLREVLAVVDGTPSGRADLANLAALGDAVDGTRVRIFRLAEHSWDELAAALADLKPGQAVLRMASFLDRDDRLLSTAEGMALLTEHSQVPVYTLRKHDLEADVGGAGGVVVDFAAQAREAARLTLAILRGATPGSLPVLTRSPNVTAIDARALARFGIGLDRVPADSEVLNAPGPRDFTLIAFGLLIAVVALSMLVVFLFLQIRQRRRAEALLSASEQRYRTLVEGSSQGVLIHRDRRPVFANQAYAELLGYASPREIIELGDTEALYAPQEHERMRHYQQLRKAGESAPAVYDVEAVRKDGSSIVLRNVVNSTVWNGEFATQHSVSDVTERERAERLLRESELRFRTLVENAPDAIVTLDADTDRFVDANDNALRLFGTTRDQFRQLGLAALSPLTQPGGHTSDEMLRDYLARALAGERVSFDWICRTTDGREIPTEVRLLRLPSSQDNRVRGSITDISERIATQRALVEKSAQLEATLENTDQGICMVDAELRMVAHNQRFLALLGLSANEFSPGDPLEKFLRRSTVVDCDQGDDADDAGDCNELAALSAPHSFVRNLADGTVLEVRGRPLPGGGFVTTYTDITETHRLSQQLAHQARHDALTDLKNRREFEERLSVLLDDARRHTREHAVCYLDLDQFKVINDTCGHLAGDELLRRLGELLTTKVRRTDLLARLGGDEFGVLLENCGQQQAMLVADTLRRTIEEFCLFWEEKSFRVGVSIGLVPVGPGSGTVDDVLRAADAACYAAKDEGRNRIHMYTEDDAVLAAREGNMHWVVRLQQALDEDRLCLVHQPIVSLDPDAGEGEHHELLVRMIDEDGSLLPPGQFLPAAERYNLMGRLDRWVVRHALEFLSASPQRVDPAFACSINLSGQTLCDDEFLAFVMDEIRRTGVSGRRIVFEVTETAAISNLSRATRFMESLKQLGCLFSLDDFGTGLSSFGYLKTLPVDFLKIDGMFVRDILDDPIDLAMVRSINEIGHVMGKRTIAEFVENDQIRERLRQLGVDYVQGYGVGRPQPLPGAESESNDRLRAGAYQSA